MKHSPFGIASAALFVGVLACAAAAAACYYGDVLAASTTGGRGWAGLAVLDAVVIGCGGSVLCAAGLGLGIAGLWDRRRDRTLAAAGVALHGLGLACAAAVVLAALLRASWR
jgi:hypothetical protein